MQKNSNAGNRVCLISGSSRIMVYWCTLQYIRCGTPKSYCHNMPYARCSYLFRHGKKSVPFGRKWRISAPGIVINNPKIIDLFSYKFYVGPHKGGFGIVNYNPRRTYCPLVPKQYTLRAAKGSLMRRALSLQTLRPE